MSQRSQSLIRQTASLRWLVPAQLVFGVALIAADDAGNSRPWSFTPLARPSVPDAAAAASWIRDDLDRFVLAKLEAAGLSQNRDADRHTLIRRACFDLTGLPPTEKEISDYLGDSSSEDQALARVVDACLQSPRFGERWARHWLDVVRYADSIGRTMNAAFAYARRYRDYVIDSFNSDKPYNRFVAEQIAGDLLPASSPQQAADAAAGTGFLALGSLDLGSGFGEAFILDQVDDQIDVTTRAFLGLTISCARCHDHKTDPVTQRDYYALAGIFYSTATWPGVAGKGNFGANGYVEPDNLLRLPVRLGERATPVDGSLPAKAGTGADPAMAMMGEEVRVGGMLTQAVFDPRLAMGVSEGDVQDCPLRIAGDPFDRDEAPRRGSITVPGLPALPDVPAQASGRLELARWITTPTHPLTARVMVNRVWQHLFGRGIVPTVDDFGITGEKPTHPELLDHLAVRFVEGGWSVKKLIRAIMLSRTWRMSSLADAAKQEVDGANDLFWRMNLRRLEVEAIRDAMFHVAGELRFDRPQGVQVAGFGGKGRDARLRSLTSDDDPWRSVYLPVMRSQLWPVQEVFDFPDPSQIKGRRDVTTVAPQALFFLNGELAVTLSRKTAALLLAGKMRDEERITHAWLRLLGRAPDAEEARAAQAMMKLLSPPDDERDPELYRWAVLVQSLMTSAEFRYVL